MNTFLINLFKNTFVLILFIGSLVFLYNNANAVTTVSPNVTTPTIESVLPVKPKQKDIYLLASLISSESYCSDNFDMHRVGSVVLNRIKSNKFPNTLKDVIYQKKQFDGVGKFNFKPNHCEDAIVIATFLLEHGSVLDKDILYYFNPKVSGSTSPWCKKMIANTVIKGKHHWYAKF